MSVLTQGTQIYVRVPAATPGSYDVLEIECATAFNPGSSPADQIDDTCLAERSTRKYRKGLRTPGQASLTVNADPQNPSHIALSEFAESDDQEPLLWVVGWADGVAPPTIGDDDDWELPTTRTWYTFQGYVSDFPFDFAGNSVVTTAASIQRSGAGAWIKKVVA